MSFTSFLREKQYLENVSTNTLRWYKHALKWLPSENPGERELKDMVIRMREAGLKATGCNANIRAMNCYLRWSGSKHTVQFLKEPQLIIPTFTADQVKILLHYRPTSDFKRRLHLLILVLFDTGCRISEALGVHGSDFDLDNLLLTLHGKGRKDRKVPISFELRKAVVKYLEGKDGPLFITSSGRSWGRMGALRSLKLHCQKLGFEPPPRTLHACRHTMATQYLARGGSVAHLSRVLGHTTLAMTMKYIHLQTEDLSAVHQRISLLS
jgi:integrase/recombinase XerD